MNLSVHCVSLMRLDYDGDNARQRTWIPGKEQLVHASADALELQLALWNANIVVDRRKSLQEGIEGARAEIALLDARATAFAKLTEEERSLLGVQAEQPAAREILHKKILDSERLIEQLSSLSREEIKDRRLVDYWWISDAVEIKTLAELQDERLED